MASTTLRSPSPLFFAAKFGDSDAPKRLRMRSIVASKDQYDDFRLRFDGGSKESSDFLPIHKDCAMGLVLSAATGRGWTTGSGMEGPSLPANFEDGKADDQPVSTLPWSLYTKLPRRRMRVAFTCNVCGQRTTRAINPHAYTDGTVFVQCCGCNVFHKLVDNLNLFDGMKCYISPNFKYEGNLPLGFLDNDDQDIFPLS